MNLTGPLPVAVIQRIDETALALRTNQRIAAEVLQVSGDHVLLALEGTRVVARLTSPDQAAALAERRQAQFIVRDLHANTVTLQLASGRAGPAPPTSLPADLMPDLLRLAGLPVNEENALVARALLGQGLPVTGDLAMELKTALAGFKNGGPAEAGTAAALKAAGLPLSPATLALAMSDLPPPPALFHRLREGLRALEREKLPPRLARLVPQALSLLETLLLDPGEPAESLPESLRAAIALLGRSLENELDEQARLGDDPHSKNSPTRSLLILAHLRRELEQHHAHQPLIKEIDNFMEGLRRMQFANAEQDTQRSTAQWLQLELLPGDPSPLASGASSLRRARLRLAYVNGDEGRSIDPAHTRLVLVVETEAGESLEADLSLAACQIGARLTASDRTLCQRAENELPGLAAGLERLGYRLRAAGCELGRPVLPEAFEGHPAPARFREVDLGA